MNLPETGTRDHEARFFGRRRGKSLRPGRAALLDSLLPRLALPRPAEGEVYDVPALFDRPKGHYRLEIGFGGGEHLAAQAKANPDIGFIGSEVFVNGIGSLLQHLEREGINGNVRVYPDDVRQILPAFPDGTFDSLFLLFPDPWPKKRHAARRFVSRDNLSTAARLLTDGGELRVASDDLNYIEWSLACCAEQSDFMLNGRVPDDFRIPPDDWIPTRYERKARQRGKACYYLSLIRKPRDGR